MPVPRARRAPDKGFILRENAVRLWGGQRWPWQGTDDGSSDPHQGRDRERGRRWHSDSFETLVAEDDGTLWLGGAGRMTGVVRMRP